MSTKSAKQNILPKGLGKGDWISFKLDNGEEYIGKVVDFGDRWLKVENIYGTTWVNLLKVVFINPSSEAEAHYDPRGAKYFYDPISKYLE